MVIYKTTNTINGKYYIGQDNYNNPNYLGSGVILKEAINKYGKENFTKEILEKCENISILNKREIYWISELDSINKGYNITVGGDGGDTFTNQSETKKKEILSKRSISMVGKNQRPLLQETKDKISKSLLGRKNPEHSKRMEGRKLSEEHKEKIVRKYKKIKVNQLTVEGDFIKTWDCVKEASESVKAKNHYGIMDCCNGNRKTSNGYKWKYYG